MLLLGEMQNIGIYKGFKAAEENLNEVTDLVKYAVDRFSHK